MLHHAVPPARGAGGAVPRRLLVRVLAVAELLAGAIEREHEVLRAAPRRVWSHATIAASYAAVRANASSASARRVSSLERAVLAELGEHVVVLRRGR